MAEAGNYGTKDNHPVKMKDAFEGIKVCFVGAAGFVTQMSGIDVALKVLIGAVTFVYVAGKTIKMFRDWNRKDKE